MSSDSADSIKGDVIPESIRRAGRDDSLIEIALVGHAHRYRVRVEIGGGAPRLVELHLISDTAVEIVPATIRQVPVRRLAHAAARWITNWNGTLDNPAEIDDPTRAHRPERPPNGGRRRKLDDVHYRQVARLLTTARESGFSPREFVSERLGGTLPTVDRWIAEAKKRGFLRRDWSTNPTTTEDDQ